MKRVNRVWVVEMYIGRRWVPTVSVDQTRDAARYDKHAWQRQNPDDRFRVRQYRRPLWTTTCAGQPRN